MIPVSIFAIGPHVAQHILDTTTIALPNLTQAACNANYSWIHNHAEITVPRVGPISVKSTLTSFKQEVWTTACGTMPNLKPGALCNGTDREILLGTYTSPTMDVTAGNNMKNFTVTMSSDKTQFDEIQATWFGALWFGSKPYRARLILKATDVSVKVMGITYKGLTMRNELTCEGILDPNTCLPVLHTVNLSAKVCGDRENSMPELAARCQSGKQDITQVEHCTPKTTTITTTEPMAQAVIV